MDEQESDGVTYITLTVEMAGTYYRSDEAVKRIVEWLRGQPNVVFAQLEDVEHDDN